MQSEANFQPRHMIQPPSPAAIVSSLRSIGYSFETAVADLIDNSITAKAAHVKILFRTTPQWFAIVDDGCGMSEDDLHEAMRLGLASSNEARHTTDLGRFGLGLKTASLSQCKRLTVITKHHGVSSAARWDLDTIVEKNEWLLELPQVENLLAEDFCEALRVASHGTVVVWEKLDRALAGEADKAQALEARAVHASEHLRLVFHRFMNGERGPFELTLNERKLNPLDPFLTQRSSIAGEEKREVYGSPVLVRAYILPHISKLTPGDISTIGGSTSLRDSQGFYIYRNLRLIIWGTWFRLIAKHELSRLARVQVDITNELDELWNLDVKKSTAYPPEQIRTLLKSIVAVVANQSASVFRERRSRSRSETEARIAVWQRFVLRDGVRYTINRSHPLIATAMLENEDSGRAIESILRIVEIALPLRGIYVDQANDVNVQQAEETISAADLQKALGLMLRGVTSDVAKLQLLETMANTEPFALFPGLMASVRESIGL